MGFRSTFTTNDYGVEWPAWFREKYKNFIHFRDDFKGPISSRHELKTYDTLIDLPEDIQKSIDWDDFGDGFDYVLVYLHECGGITRCQIERDAILWTEPWGWHITDGVQHSYCYGCSDARKAEDA